MIRIFNNRAGVWLLGSLMAAAFAFSAPIATTAEEQNKDPIRIGFSMALSGALGGGGQQALLGMKIWADDVNEAGGLLGRPVELIVHDDQSNPKAVAGIYSELLDIDKVDLIVSGYGTSLIAPAMPVAVDRKMVFMSLFGTNVNAKWKYENYFSMHPVGPAPAAGFSQHWFAAVEKFKPKTIAIISAEGPFAQNLKRGAVANAKAMGLEIVYEHNYNRKTADFKPILLAANAETPDVIYIASYPNGSAGLVRALSEVGSDAKAVGGGMFGLQFSGLMAGLGSKLNGISNYDFFVPEPTMVAYPGARDLISRYQAKVRAENLKVDPLGYFLVPWSYAYVDILGQAVNAVGSLDQQAIADYIRKTEFTSVVGRVKFGKNGEWEQSRTLVVQYQDIENNDLLQFSKPGKRKIILPGDIRTGELQPFGALRK